MVKFWLALLCLCLTLPVIAQENNIREKALSYRGTRYRWGGTSRSGGFDCSGFVKTVFSHFKITLPRNSRGMLSAGIKVAKSTLKTGDIIFFATRGKGRVSHVGIYLSDGEFIHSASSGVRTSKLSEPYYAKRYVSARRITNLVVPKSQVTSLKKKVLPSNSKSIKVE